MDWAAVVAAAVAGAVGVGGTIAGARIASKSATKDLQLSINAENARARDAEKRRIYASCLANMWEMVDSTIAFREVSDEWLAEHKEEMTARQRKASIATDAAIFPAQLIASPEVARQLRDYAGKIADYSDKLTSQPREEALREAEKLGREWSELCNAMRVDLGETS